MTPSRSFFFFSSRRRHTRSLRDWSSDVCSSDLPDLAQESLDPGPGLDPGRSGLADARGLGALAGGHAFPRVHQERRVGDEVEQVTETAARILGRPAVQLACILRTAK